MFLLTAWVSCSFFSTWARESGTFVHSNGPQVCFFHVYTHQRLQYASIFYTREKKIDSFSNGEKSRNSVRNLMGHFQVRNFRMSAKFLVVFDYSRLDECVKQSTGICKCVKQYICKRKKSSKNQNKWSNIIVLK